MGLTASPVVAATSPLAAAAGVPRGGSASPTSRAVLRKGFEPPGWWACKTYTGRHAFRIVRRMTTTHHTECLVHGPGDDECLARYGRRCVTASGPRHPYVGVTWEHVVAANDAAIRFPNATNPLAEARMTWLRLNGGCVRHGNERDDDFRTGCWECDVEADIARRDRGGY